MTLCDTGPLVALIDRNDPDHALCSATIRSLPSSPLLTTWSCLTESMYFLGKTGGLPAQDELWGLHADGYLKIHVAEEKETLRMRQLMRKYADSPMDLADASLVTAAEELGLRRLFTLDGHFHAYRILGRDTFKVVP